jgi:hypothetical protein
MVVSRTDSHRTEDAFLISVRFRNCEEPRIYRAHCWYVQWQTRAIWQTPELTLRTHRSGPGNLGSQPPRLPT